MQPERPETATALVDGGATGTRAELWADGKRVGAGLAGPSSLSLGIEASWANIAAALSVAGHAGGPVRLIAGLAGARVPGNVEAFHAADPLGCRHIRVVTDGYAALVGAFDGAPGTVIAVGTGVTVQSMDAEGTVREASGWGFPVGDEGSGAWLGRAAAGWLTRVADGRAAPSPDLADRLIALTGEDDALRRWLAAADATVYATLAPAVVDAAATDAVAAALLDEGAAALDAGLDAVGPSGPVACVGGLGATYAGRLAPRHAERLLAPAGGALDGLRRLAAPEPVPPQ